VAALSQMDDHETDEDEPDIGVDCDPNVQKVEGAQRGGAGDQEAKVHDPAGPRPQPNAPRGDSFGRRFDQGRLQLCFLEVGRRVVGQGARWRPGPAHSIG
jgi:hypothetical protein